MEWQTYLIGSQIHTLFAHKQSLRHRNPYLLQSLVLQIFRFHCVSPKNYHPMNKQQYIWTNTRRDKSFKWDWDVIWKCWRDSHIIRGHYLLLWTDSNSIIQWYSNSQNSRLHCIQYLNKLRLHAALPHPRWRNTFAEWTLDRCRLRFEVEL